MKLNHTQIELVGDTLIEKGLVYRDFYDELLDHFCSAIEDKMAEGLTFKKALNGLLLDLNKIESKAIFGSYRNSFSGLKALQHLKFKAIDKKVKKELLSQIGNQVLSYRIIFWIILFLLSYRFAPTSFSIDIMIGDGFFRSFIISFIWGLGIVAGAFFLTPDSLMEYLHNSVYKVFAKKMTKANLITKAEKDATWKLLAAPIILVYAFFIVSHLQIEIRIIKTIQASLLVLIGMMLSTIWQMLSQKKAI
ncbi:hypothetical protein SAMN06298216_1569 [Spirosomataceae bacterium TFI 002]|nr:hypothetical protein SAMN06298216_1569 [Spirosomataceae bacterium TFI 002]